MCMCVCMYVSMYVCMYVGDEVCQRHSQVGSQRYEQVLPGSVPNPHHRDRCWLVLCMYVCVCMYVYST